MKKTHNVGREFDELVVTSGAQQVMAQDIDIMRSIVAQASHFV